MAASVNEIQALLKANFERLDALRELKPQSVSQLRTSLLDIKNNTVSAACYILST